MTRRRAALLAYVLLSLGYLGWRALDTRTPAAPIYFAAFLALETWATVCAICFYWTTAERKDPTPPPAPRGLSVDVFICTYNESVTLVRQTVRRAMAMDYPHRTFLLDDGRRPAMRALAAELGAHYLTREQNTHYKAGNLNHALAHSDAELVVVLDADHLVAEHFLTRLLGYFRDPDVAFVQTPQIYYNLDSFQHHFRPRERKLWHEGAIFHHALQPGANRWNAAFFVGTGAILRRSALDRVGGFAIGSTTEDAFTSMRLHAAGYRSIYHDEPLGYLLAPESLQQYLTQRLRWGQGSLQILRRENPLSRPGLKLRQRMVYFMALGSFAQALVHLAYYLAPAIFLLGGPAPLRIATPWHFLPLCGHILLDVVMFKRWLGPLARPLLAECYKFLNVYVFLKSLVAYVLPSRRLRFHVTTKGRDDSASLLLLAPQALLMALNATALACGLIRLGEGGLPLVNLLGIALSAAFAGLFVLIGGMTMLYAHERIASRREHSFTDHIPSWIVGTGAAPISVEVVRANQHELHVLAVGRGVPEHGRIQLQLLLESWRPVLEVQGTIVGRFESLAGSVLQVALDPLPSEARDRLFDRFAEHAIPATIDSLIASWSGHEPLPRNPDVSAPYLTLEPEVL